MPISKSLLTAYTTKLIPLFLVASLRNRLAYNIVYKKSVYRDLKKLDKTEAGRIISQTEQDLSKKPETYAVLKGRFSGLRKYRVGNYRVIYAIIGTDVLILKIGHRGDVYK